MTSRWLVSGGGQVDPRRTRLSMAADVVNSQRVMQSRTGRAHPPDWISHHQLSARRCRHAHQRQLDEALGDSGQTLVVLASAPRWTAESPPQFTLQLAPGRLGATPGSPAARWSDW